MSMGERIDAISVRQAATPELGKPVEIVATAAPSKGSAGEETDAKSEATEDERQEAKNQASKLVAFVQEHAELFHDGNRDVFALTKDTREVLRLGGTPFKDWLMAGFYRETRKAAKDQAVREAASVLTGIGREEGDAREVHTRVAFHHGAYFLDLAEEGKGRVVKICLGSWEVVEDPPVYFIRPGAMRPLPEPQRGGTVDPLWNIANIPEDARLLVLAWLCESLRPETPFPLLELIGEAGSAKSTTHKAIRLLIDPNKAPLRTVPRNRDDLAVTAGESWVFSIENVSHLTPDLQDALCTLATGGGFSKRKNYTDAEEIVLDTKRPTLLNGIAVAITAQDLVNRTISIELPSLTGENIEEPVLWQAFEAEQGRILGALLDIFANALLRLSDVRLPSNLTDTRLISFLKLGVAVAEACGQPAEAFLFPFQERRQEAVSRTLDASPVGTAIQTWFERHPQGQEGTPTDLLRLMEKPLNCDYWPHGPKQFSDQMRRIAPALRTVGIECRALTKEEGGHTRRGNLWKIRPCTA